MPTTDTTKPTTAAKGVVPSVGNIMWYWPHGDLAAQPPRPLAAIVTRVKADDRVTLSVWTHRGQTTFVEDVDFVQRDDDKPTDMPYCEWPVTPHEQAPRVEQEKAKAKAEADKAEKDAAKAAADAKIEQDKVNAKAEADAKAKSGFVAPGMQTPILPTK